MVYKNPKININIYKLRGSIGNSTSVYAVEIAKTILTVNAAILPLILRTAKYITKMVAHCMNICKKTAIIILFPKREKTNANKARYKLSTVPVRCNPAFPIPMAAA